MDEYELDEFEAMEAEAEALAAQNSKAPKAPIRPANSPPRPAPAPAQRMAARPQSKPQAPARPQQAQQPVEEPQPLWVAYYQPKSIGVVNTQTGERMEGFNDEGVAQSMARILNDLNTVIVSGGYE
jgi:hypothetical protein